MKHSCKRIKKTIFGELGGGVGQQQQGFPSKLAPPPNPAIIYIYNTYLHNILTEDALGSGHLLVGIREIVY